MAVLTAAILMLSTLQPVDDETVALAGEVGVDPVELAGAVVTTQSTPRTYLEHEGLIDRPRQTVGSVAPVRANSGLWDRLAACESGGRWHLNVGLFDGGLQFLPSTWNAYKFPGYPAFAWQATREQQIAVAQRLQAAAGWGQWPACSRRLGLR